MEKEQAREAFVKGAEAAFDELEAWCAAHPNYSLLELEEKTRVVRQQLMGEVMSSLIAERGSAKRVEGVICPRCGERMEDKGRQTRAVEGPEGRVRLSRSYYHCTSCKEGFFPSGQRVTADKAPLE